ncbi:hypothetical protein HKD37_06G016396 [Glycine soja]
MMGFDGVWWEDVCLPKEKGGLGVKNIRKFNVALHRKWRWRLRSCQNELWYKVLCSNELMAKQDYLLWKNGSTGNYTIKDAYNTLIVTNDHVDSFFYRNLWALPIPNNVSVFLWRLANN